MREQRNAIRALLSILVRPPPELSQEVGVLELLRYCPGSLSRD